MRGPDAVPAELPTFTAAMLSPLAIPDYPHAVQYLETFDPSKPVANRVVAWLLQFGLLAQDRPHEWPAALSELVVSYDSLRSQYCPDYTQDQLNAATESIVSRDLERSTVMLSETFNNLGVDTSLFADPVLRGTRVFLLISKVSPKLKWAQGYDRFLSISAAVSSAFCEALGLSADVSEAICYAISSRLIGHVSFADEVLGGSREIFDEVAKAMKRRAPATFSGLASQNLEPKVYALRWVLILFADQHPARSLLVIWDFILLHLDRKQECLCALVVAHLNQVELGTSSFETVRRIQGKTDFRIGHLIKDTVRFMGKAPLVVESGVGKRGIPFFTAVTVPLIIIVIAGYFLYNVFLE
jgi:hypothetical protein